MSKDKRKVFVSNTSVLWDAQVQIEKRVEVFFMLGNCSLWFMIAIFQEIVCLASIQSPFHYDFLVIHLQRESSQEQNDCLIILNFRRDWIIKLTSWEAKENWQKYSRKDFYADRHFLKLFFDTFFYLNTIFP